MQDINSLQKQELQESKKENELNIKINRAQEASEKASNISIAQMKIREIARLKSNLLIIGKKKVGISTKIISKTKELQKYKNYQSKEDDKKRKEMEQTQREAIQIRQQQESNLLASFINQKKAIHMNKTSSQSKYDFFISHASEDKEDFVRELAKRLEEAGARVWYDEHSLKIGDSLQKEIDKGLLNSRFGIVVVSENFFKKNWAQKELEGLSAIENNENETKILPIWHKVSIDEVTKYSPTLANKLALNTSLDSTGEIINKLMKLLDAK